jgi:hypothetical protein
MRHSDTLAIGRLRPPMPRRSPFDVRLSSDERVRLETMARKYTSPYCDVIRAKIILLADTSELLLLFSGRSRVATFRPSWPRWVANASPPPPDAASRIRYRNYESAYY